MPDSTLQHGKFLLVGSEGVGLQSLGAVIIAAPLSHLAALPVRAHRLAVCTGSTKVYLWSPEGASCVHIPLPGFRASSLRWPPAGACLLLADKEAVCCAYLG